MLQAIIQLKYCYAPRLQLNETAKPNDIETEMRSRTYAETVAILWFIIIIIIIIKPRAQKRQLPGWLTVGQRQPKILFTDVGFYLLIWRTQVFLLILWAYAFTASEVSFFAAGYGHNLIQSSSVVVLAPKKLDQFRRSVTIHQCQTHTHTHTHIHAHIHTTRRIDRTEPLARSSNKYKNSSGDELANVNFYAVRPEATRIRWNDAK